MPAGIRASGQMLANGGYDGLVAEEIGGLPVDEEGGRAPGAQIKPGLRVLLHIGFIAPGIQTTVKRLAIQADLDPILF